MLRRWRYFPCVLCFYWLAMLESSLVFANQDPTSVYLQFESDYLSNNATRYAPWLIEDLQVSQTMHISGLGSDSRTVSAHEILKNMQDMDAPSRIKTATPEQVTITDVTPTGFCANAKVESVSSVSGSDYDETEARRVCFEHRGGRYQVVEHSIDVFYRKSN